MGKDLGPSSMSFRADDWLLKRLCKRKCVDATDQSTVVFSAMPIENPRHHLSAQYRRVSTG